MGTKLIEERSRGTDITDLPTQQQTFLLSLMASKMFSPTEAAREAGYKNPSQASYRLLQKPAIQAALGKALRQRREMMQHTSAEVMAELDYIAFRDPIALCQDGVLVTDDLRKIPPEMRRCIDGIELDWKVTWVGTGKRKKPVLKPYMKLKMMSKEAAMTLIMRHRGMLAPTEASVNVNIGIVQQVLAEPVEERGKSQSIEDRIEQGEGEVTQDIDEIRDEIAGLLKLRDCGQTSVEREFYVQLSGLLPFAETPTVEFLENRIAFLEAHLKLQQQVLNRVRRHMVRFEQLLARVREIGDE